MVLGSDLGDTVGEGNTASVLNSQHLVRGRSNCDSPSDRVKYNSEILEMHLMLLRCGPA